MNRYTADKLIDLEKKRLKIIREIDDLTMSLEDKQNEFFQILKEINRLESDLYKINP